MNLKILIAPGDLSYAEAIADGIFGYKAYTSRRNTVRTAYTRPCTTRLSNWRNQKECHYLMYEVEL